MVVNWISKSPPKCSIMDNWTEVRLREFTRTVTPETQMHTQNASTQDSKCWKYSFKFSNYGSMIWKIKFQNLFYFLVAILMEQGLSWTVPLSRRDETPAVDRRVYTCRMESESEDELYLWVMGIWKMQLSKSTSWVQLIATELENKHKLNSKYITKRANVFPVSLTDKNKFSAVSS